MALMVLPLSISRTNPSFCLVKDSWAEASTEVLINPNPPPTKKNREKDDKDMLMVELRLVLGLLTTSYWLFVLVIKLFQDL